MNLIDAIKSGRPFRRKSRAGIDYFWTLGKDVNCAQLGKTQNVFCIDDLLADDWETKDVEVTITRASFEEAVKRCTTHFWPDNDGKVNFLKQLHLVPVEELARRLGLVEGE